MIPQFFTQEQALEKINQQLRLNGLAPISARSLYRLRLVYLRFFPRSKWLVNSRLIYSEQIILFLYFLCRMHALMGTFELTAIGFKAVLDKIPGVVLTDKLPTFSAIDTFFQTNSAGNFNAA